jgi:radical SAM protein with 4Fe4S-binding SPASM domain
LVELYLEMVHSKRHFRITTFEEDNVRNADEPTPFGCGAGRGRFAVDPLGDLYGCSKMATIMGPGNGALPLGNVFQGYTRIDNRRCCLDATVEHRQTCRCCELREFCGGGCPATNFADTGNTYLPGDTACKLVFISRRVNEYVRRRRQDVFGANPTKDRACRPSAGPSDTDRRDRRLGNE